MTRDHLAPPTPPTRVEALILKVVHLFTEGQWGEAENLLRHDLLAAVRHALRAQPPTPSGWQPIETAPKDGTLVDLFVDGHRETDCCWHRLDWEIAYLHWPADSMGWATWSERDGEYGRIEPAPTHWQPLPAPPQTPEPQTP